MKYTSKYSHSFGRLFGASWWRRFTAAAVACLTAVSGANAAALTQGNLVVGQVASASNTTLSLVELAPGAQNQSAVQTINIDAIGTNALRVSGSASSTLYLSHSNDRTLLTFNGANSADTSSNVNTLNPRAVGTIDASGSFQLKTSYTGTSGSQTRSATALDNATWYIADQAGLYTNGTAVASPAGNFRSVKAFGGMVYLFQGSATAAPVSTVSAASGGTVTGLPGLPNGTTSAQDFYLISSGDNGAAYDVLYVLSATSATAGTIAKYSLVSGTWTANGVFTTTFGGFGLAAADSGNGADLYVTTGTGATLGNSVIRLTEAAGFNTAINITASQALYTAAATAIVKGIDFAPVAPAANADLSTLSLSSGTLTPAFAAGTTSYTASVGNNVTSLTVTPTSVDAAATLSVRVNGGTYAPVASGAASGSLALNVGANAIDVQVINGTTTKVYTVTVTRQATSNVNLSSLTLSAGTLSPAFAAATNAYQASEANSVSSITVTPTVADGTSGVQVRVNGGLYSNVVSGSASPALALNEGLNTIDILVTGQDGTTKTYSIAVGRAPTVYTSSVRDILEPNRGAFPTTGVTAGGTQFINLGLQGVGRVPANSLDPVTGESLGSVSDMQITNFVKNANGTYSGTFNFLPDRGYNSGSIFSNYAARINKFDFTFAPYTAATPTTLQNQIALTFTGSTRFTYDHDANATTPSIFTTGQLADGATVGLFGTTIPTATGSTKQSDGTFNNRLTVDAEALILDTRPGKTGSGWMGDEYGAYVYHFNANKQIDGVLPIPPALVPHAPVGTTNFLLDPAVNGRRVNQGFEGATQTPDGKKLIVLLQSATIQDSGSGNQGRSNTRLLVYDISASDTPAAPVKQYVIQLPRADDTGLATNGLSVNRNAAQSSILAINDHQFLILARDGNGRGVAGSASPVFKSVLLADFATATNITGQFENEGAAVAPGGVLNATVTPITWTEAVNLIGKLTLANATEVEKFGFNLSGGNGDLNTICEKWEALGLVSANDPANPNDYFLFVGNDNDFLSASGKYMDAAGTIQSYDAGLENDTIIFAYRVRIAAGTNFRFTQATASASEANGTVTITLTRDGDLSATATVFVTTNDSTAKAGTDFTALTQFPVNFAAGSATATVQVSLKNRPGIQGGRTFTVTVSSPDAGTLGTTTTSTVTITEADMEGTLTGPSSSQTPYVLPLDNSFRTTAVLTVGDTVPKTATTTGQTYAMVGIPDGLGAFDNNDGTITLLMNHELGNTAGGARDHGAAGAFVSSWIINKSTLQVLSGADLMQQVFNWNAVAQASATTTSTIAFNRFCSADLPAPGAFYNPASGLGTQERIYLNGEEGGSTGFALAHVATGTNKGNTYVLGKFNLATNGSGLTGVGGWENILASPFPQDKTVVIGNNDGGTGAMNNTVAVYVGTKTSTGTEADKAGLNNGALKFINVAGNPVEIIDTTTRATNIGNGTRFSLNATSGTVFSRPEDGAWNPLNAKQYYFVTTDRLDQVADQVGAQIGRTRLWRLTFDDISNPDLGGTIDLLATGGVNNDANMWDNLAVTADGLLFLQEDVGGAAHNGKVWQYDPATGLLKKVLKHDVARFGEVNGGVVTTATAPFTNDEESSGIIDVTSLFGGNAAAGQRFFFTADQAHYVLPGALVEGGQLVFIQQVASQSGLSSSQTPYVVPVDRNFQTTSVLTVGDAVPKTGSTTGQTYQMVGIPDGLGAFDNGDGTLTLLMNHELGNTAGVARDHGAAGAFVSSWVINKSNLCVLSGSDLIKQVYNWDSAAQASAATTSTVAFNRFCSADLPAVSAFYNAASGLGTQTRIYLNGEEGGSTGYALAHVANGADKGKTYVLGKFNLSTNGSGLTGVGGWENVVANPFAQDKTVVVGTNDGGTGVMNNTVSVYVGTKTNAGTEADKAGLTNGAMKFVSVTGNPVEITDTTTRATSITSGTRFTLSAAGGTTFSRPEDGAWNPLDAKQFYFVTTDRLDQVADGVGTQIGRTRLWRLTFDDISHPDAGGVIDLLVTGGVGNDANMWDNLTVNSDGRLLLQEDVGGASHNGKVWQYDPATGSLKKVLKHDAGRFGDVTTNGVVVPATAPYTNDEEASGIIDVTGIFGANAAAGEHVYFTADQAHYVLANPLVEGGQLVLIREKPAIAFSLSQTVTSIKEGTGNVTVTINRFGDLSQPGSVRIGTVDGSAIAGTDFTGINDQTVEFGSGQATATVAIPIANLAGPQGDRTFTVRLASTGGDTVIGTPSSESITITEADSTYQIENSAYTILENAGPLLVNITRIGALPAADVTLTGTNGTAIAGTDYTAPANAVHFNAGQTSATASIAITDRSTTAQGTRTFSLALTAVPAGSTIAGTPAIVTITEAQGPGGVLSFTTSSIRLSPTNETKQPNRVTVTVKRTGSAQGTVSVTVTASQPQDVPPGHQLANGTDYTFAGDSTVLTFAEGETTKPLTIPLAAKVKAGQLLLTLSNPTGGATIGTPSQVTIEVTKKDIAPPLLLLSLSAPDVNGVSALSGFTMDQKDPASGIFSVSYTVKNVNGTSSPQAVPLFFGAFSETVQLQHGLNTVAVTALDNAGNTTVKTATVTFRKPEITALPGNYSGLLIPVGTASNATSGLLTVTVTASTAVTGKLTAGGKTTSFGGSLDSAGNVHFKPTGATTLAVGSLSLSVQFAAGDAIGTLKSGGADLAAAKAEKDAAANAGLVNGKSPQKYTLVFPSKAQAGLTDAEFPQGDGYATLTVNASGSFTAIGTLADGITFTAGGHLNVAGAASQPGALFVSLPYKGGAGSLAAPLVFDLSASTHPGYDVLGANSLWIRSAIVGAKSYPNGWPAGLKLDAIGARLTIPASASLLPGLNTTSPNAQLQFADGQLTGGSLSLDLALSTKNAFTNKSGDTKLTLAIIPSTGVFNGFFTHSNGLKTPYSGIILQEGANAKGFGFFLSTPAAPVTGQSGAVVLQPLP